MYTVWVSRNPLRLIGWLQDELRATCRRTFAISQLRKETIVNKIVSGPPIERFCIRGLHGYKDVEIDFCGKSTVVVAENGTGKTTLLNALNAFVTRRFHRLDAIKFDFIECQFSGSLLPLTISKNQLTSSRYESIAELAQLASAASMPEINLSEFMTHAYTPGSIDRYRSHPVVRQLYVNTNHGWESLEHTLNELHKSLDSTLTDAAKALSEEIRRRMGDIEVVFLPTYRRIERPILRPARAIGGVPSSRRREQASSEHDDMAFGLADVQDRLLRLSDDIERRSNIEYRTLSARMLDDMLTRQSDSESIDSTKLPDINSLALFLSRVDRTLRSSSFGTLERIRNLYESGRIHDNENQFLRYFLSQLSLVIEETKETELVVERFVEVCNSYLTLSSDEKSLSLDPQSLRVVVRNSWTNDPISLDDLSSGEKQIVSLMARLHLSPRPKLVLIDEPELSLSLDWQRKVLPDVANSPSVVQLLAITHSPFVFDNELDQYTRSFNISRTENVNVETT